MSQNEIDREQLSNNDPVDDIANILENSNKDRSRLASDNEVDNLLNNYGVGVEAPEQRSYMNDRLEKMRQRVTHDTPTSQQIASKKSPVAFILWLLGCVLLIALIIVQYVVFNVNTLVKDADANAKLMSACKILSCSLPSADLNNLQLGGVGHRASLVGSADRESDVIASLINHGTQPQLYPNLRVSIQGENGLLGEFVAQPKDYLISEEQVEMAPSHEVFFMFTVPVHNDEILSVDIKPFY